MSERQAELIVSAMNVGTDVYYQGAVINESLIGTADFDRLVEVEALKVLEAPAEVSEPAEVMAPVLMEMAAPAEAAETPEGDAAEVAETPQDDTSGDTTEGEVAPEGEEQAAIVKTRRGAAVAGTES